MARDIATPVRIARRYGLISAAQVIQDEDLEPIRFRPSVNFAAQADRTKAWAVNCAKTYDKSSVGNAAHTGTDPFAVITGVECTPVGITDADFIALATVALEGQEETRLEQVAHDGVLEDGDTLPMRLQRNAALVESFRRIEATQVLGAGAEDLRLGLGLLQDAVADVYGGQGTLHVPRQFAEYMPDGWRIEGQNIVTKLGNVVSLGAGYPNESPAGVAAGAGQAWLYATGPVQIRRSSLQVVGDFVSSVDKRQNTLTRYVERTYSISWDPAVAWAVLVDLPVDGGGP